MQTSDQISVSLELSNALIKDQAEPDEICSLVLTQYGDLRSFLVSKDGSSADDDDGPSYGSEQGQLV